MKTWWVTVKISRICHTSPRFRSTLPCSRGEPCAHYKADGWLPCRTKHEYQGIEAETEEAAIEAAVNLARLDGAGGPWFNRELDVHETEAEEI